MSDTQLVLGMVDLSRALEAPDPYALPAVPFKAPRRAEPRPMTDVERKARVDAALEQLAIAGGYQRPPLAWPLSDVAHTKNPECENAHA